MQGEEGRGRIRGDGRRLDVGGEHTIRRTRDALWNCAPETCRTVLTGVTPISSIKRKEERKIGLNGMAE